MNQFVDGQRIKCVYANGANLTEGKEYVVAYSNGTDVVVLDDSGMLCSWMVNRFVSNEAEKVATVLQKSVTISYGILSVTFDLSKPLGRKLMEAALDVIYKDAAA